MSDRLGKRVLSDAQVARELLGCCPATFRRKRKGLEKEGFPKRDVLLGGYHRSAVTAWLDSRAAVTNPARPETLADLAAVWGKSA